MPDFCVNTETPEELKTEKSMTDPVSEKILQIDARLLKPDEMRSPDELFRELMVRVRRYHPSGDLSGIEKAYQVASEAHKDQHRKSGEPYIIHPLCVSVVLADLEMDKETIAAGLLHDVVEDTVLTREQIEQKFGSDVALLVDGSCGFFTKNKT